jgi:hypothetical protein
MHTYVKDEDDIKIKNNYFVTIKGTSILSNETISRPIPLNDVDI